MADLADTAQQITERFLEHSLRNHAVPVTRFSGMCMACGDPVHERRFCDRDCRQLYESEIQPRLVIRGVLPLPRSQTTTSARSPILVPPEPF